MLSDLWSPIGDVRSTIAQLIRERRAWPRGTRSSIRPRRHSRSQPRRVLRPEDGHSITVGRAEAWREDYQKRLERHRAEIRAETGQLGWSFIIHRTDRPATELLLKLHAQMGQGPRGGSVGQFHAGALSA